MPVKNTMAFNLTFGKPKSPSEQPGFSKKVKIAFIFNGSITKAFGYKIHDIATQKLVKIKLAT